MGFAQPRETAGLVLPPSLTQLLAEFDISEPTTPAPAWDFMWNASVEEGREKRLLACPFTSSPDKPLPANGSTTDADFIAESALKVSMHPRGRSMSLTDFQMVLGTPNDRYDADLASQMLHAVGEQSVSAATKNLLGHGVLSKLVRDPTKQRPGRQLKISEV